MEKDARLILFHVDRFADGDDVDRLLDRLYTWGALHVQAMPTVGRGGTAAYTVLAEVDPVDEWRFARDLAATMGIARYHRLASTYCYQPVTTSQRPVVATWHGTQVSMTVRFHLIGTERNPLYVRVVEDDVQALHERIREACAADVTAPELQRRLEALLAEETGFVLALEETAAGPPG